MGVQIRQKKRAGDRISLYLDIYHAGKRSYEFLDIYLTKDRQANKESMALAESIKAKRILEIQNSEHGFIPAFKKKINFIEYFEKKAKERNPPSSKTGRFATHDSTYLSALNHVKGFAGESIHFSAINEEWLEEFKKYLLTKMKQITAHTYFAKVKAVLHDAQKEKIILVSPADNVSNFPKPEGERQFMSLEELKKLSETPCSKPDVKRAFLFCCYTGLRLSDMANLKWNQLEGDRLIFKQRKTGVVQYHPLNETAKRLIMQCKTGNVLPMPDSYIFSDLGGKSHVHLYLQEWFKKAELKQKYTFHCSRHTFATSLLTSGADIFTVSKLMGHTSVATTAIYAKVIDKKKEDAVNGLPEIGVSA